MIRLYGIITLAAFILSGAAVMASAAFGNWLPRPDYDTELEYASDEVFNGRFTHTYVIDQAYDIHLVTARIPGILSPFRLRLAEDLNWGMVFTFCAATCDLWLSKEQEIRPITNTPDISEIYPTWNWLRNNELAFAACDADFLFCDMMLWDSVMTRNLTNTPDMNEQFAVWSSDGRLAFDRCDANQICDVMMWDGAVVHNLTNTPNISESFERWNSAGEIGIQYCSGTCSSLAYMDGETLTWLSDVPPVQQSAP